MGAKKKKASNDLVTAVSVYGFPKRAADSYEAGDDSHWLVRFRDLSLLGGHWTPWVRLSTWAWDRLSGYVAVEQSYDAYQMSEGHPTVDTAGSLMYPIVPDRDHRQVTLEHVLRTAPADSYPGPGADSDDPPAAA